jgi:hypothetical protein
MVFFGMLSLLGLTVIVSTVAFSAHFVGEQIEYLHQKVSPSSRDLNISAEWPIAETALPKLEDQLSDRMQTASPAALTVFSIEKAVITPSR